MKITWKNLFTFLKENKIVAEVKNAIVEILKNEKDELKTKLQSYLESKSDVMKNVFAEYLLSKIQLPLIAKPFKGWIKNIIVKNLDKLIDFISEQIDKI